MGGVGALQPRLARRRDGAQIAADIGGGQAEAPQARDHDMREILADAVAIGEGFADRGRDLGRFGIVGEILADAGHQLARRLEDRPLRRKAPAGVAGDLRYGRRQPAGVEILGRGIRREALRPQCEFGDILPAPRQGGEGCDRPCHLDPRGHLDLELTMRLGDGQCRRVVAEEADTVPPLSAARRHREAARQHTLANAVTRQHPQDAARERDRPAIGVSRKMANVVDHAASITPIASSPTVPAWSSAGNSARPLHWRGPSAIARNRGCRCGRAGWPRRSGFRRRA